MSLFCSSATNPPRSDPNCALTVVHGSDLRASRRLGGGRSVPVGFAARGDGPARLLPAPLELLARGLDGVARGLLRVDARLQLCLAAGTWLLGEQRLREAHVQLLVPGLRLDQLVARADEPRQDARGLARGDVLLQPLERALELRRSPLELLALRRGDQHELLKLLL